MMIGTVDVYSDISCPWCFIGTRRLEAMLRERYRADPRTMFARVEAAATTRGVRGVPFFIINEKLAFSGAQPVEVFRGAIARALEA